MKVTHYEIFQAKHLPQVMEIGLYPVDCRSFQHTRHSLDHLLPVVALHYQLCQKRVIVGRYLGTGFYPSVYSASCRECYPRKQSSRRLELFRRIFGVQAHLHGGAGLGEGDFFNRFHLSGCKSNHPLNKVHPEGLLGYRMFHLEPCIHLEKIKCVRFIVIHELHCSCRTV